MAGSNTCFSLVRGRAMRVTRLDGCGSVDLGPDAAIVSDGFITVQLTAQTDEGETISVTNAAGKVCILDEPCPVFTGYEIQVEFCGVDPLLYELMTGHAVDRPTRDGNRVGIRINSGVDACASGFALEVWSNVPSAVCDPRRRCLLRLLPGPVRQGRRHRRLHHRQRRGQLHPLRGQEQGRQHLGRRTVRRGQGRHRCSRPAAGGGRLSRPPAHAADHRARRRSRPAMRSRSARPPPAPPPEPRAPTPRPRPTARTTSPRSTRLTASPTTAWTTGQYIVLEDGTFAHWDGTAWAAGRPRRS